jgi:hypothetical protein
MAEEEQKVCDEILADIWKNLGKLKPWEPPGIWANEDEPLPPLVWERDPDTWELNLCNPKPPEDLKGFAEDLRQRVEAVLAPLCGDKACKVAKVVLWDCFYDTGKEDDEAPKEKPWAFAGGGKIDLRQELDYYLKTVSANQLPTTYAFLYTCRPHHCLTMTVDSNGTVQVNPKREEIKSSPPQLTTANADFLDGLIDAHTCWADRSGQQRFIYYIPSLFYTKGGGQGIGGLVLVTEPPLHFTDSHLIQMRSIVERILSPIGIAYLAEKFRREARSSAIAGIMSRNMSHNIGSHVLASPALQAAHRAGELTRLHRYLQQRMDFVAQVVTYSPSWGEPLFFFKDLWDTWMRQYLLLAYLVGDEFPPDQGQPSIQFSVMLMSNGSACPHTFQLVDDRNADSGKGIRHWECPDTVEDFLVSIPGGMVGAHAFYDILENIMRNSAKYGTLRPPTLQILLRVTEEDECYRVEVFDNLSVAAQTHEDGCDCCVCRVRQRLEEPLIGETGKIEVKSRGVYEMKECARILAHAGVPCGEDRRSPIAVRPSRHPLIQDGNDYMCYEFALQKPRLVGIWGTDPPQEDTAAKRAGVLHYRERDNLWRYPNQMAVLVAGSATNGATIGDIRKFIAEKQRLLPYRVLVLCDTDLDEARSAVESQGTVPKRRVQFAANRELDDRGEWDRLVLRLYARWLGEYERPKDKGNWVLVISFAREGEEVRRWCYGVGAQGFRELACDLVDVYVITENGVKACSVNGGGDTRLRNALRDRKDAVLVLDHHKRMYGMHQWPFKVNPERVRFYQQFDASSARLFHTLASPPPPGFGFDFFVLGLLESAIMDIVIVDERVAVAAVEEDNYRSLRRMGVQAVYSWWTQHTSDREFLSKEIESRASAIHVAEGLRFKDALSNLTTSLCVREGEEYGRSPGAIIIHQGVIDRLGNLKHWTGEKDPKLQALYGMSPRIIITSGRGRTLRDVHSDTPFLEFSAIGETTVRERSKYHLIRALTAVRGEAR